LPRAFFVYTEGRISPADTFPGLGRSFQPGKSPAQIGPELVRALVFGNGAYKFLETDDFLRNRPGCAISPFRLNSRWGKVYRHGYLLAYAFFLGASQRPPSTPGLFSIS